MRLKQYPKYKESGMRWIGTIPTHWEIRRLRTIAQVISSGVDKNTNDCEMPVKLCNYLDVYKNERITNLIDFMKATATPEEISKFELKSGDVLITKDSEMWNDIAVPAFVPENLPGVICAYHLAIVRPKEIEGEFLFMAFLAESIADQFRVSANGVTRYGLSQSAIKNAWLPIPPKEEQKVIAAFIRAKEKKITKFIRNKRRLIQLLKEQKQAIINQAVTRGINPDVKMKPSGVDWVGRIPVHWEVKKLKTIAKMKSGENITSMDIEENANYPVYGGNGIRGYCQNYTHEGLFLLVGRQGALCGNVHRVEGRFWASEHAVVTTVKKEFDIDWYYYLLIAMNLNQYSEAAAQPGISVEKIQNLKTIVPPIKEQEKIAGFINKESVRIDQTISYAHKEIELIQEYRTRLISDVVTGKVDVRDIKVEDIEEDELPEDMPDTEEFEDSIEDGKEV